MIASILQYYEQTWLPLTNNQEEVQIIKQFKSFLPAGPRIFERDFYDNGHITASTLVVSSDFERVLLTLHGKLKIWLQLGGHTDGQAEVHVAAMREAQEESGLKNLNFLNYEFGLRPPQPPDLKKVPIPFDLDVHAMPARKHEPSHYHYDIRYAIVANPDEPLVISEESEDLRWFTLAEARAVTQERSMHRQFDKLALLKEIMARRID